jgi:hypothetical protein
MPFACRLTMWPSQAHTPRLEPVTQLGGSESVRFEERPAVRANHEIAFTTARRRAPLDQARSNARFLSSSKDTYSSAFSCVARGATRGAIPASSASFQRAAHRHQRSPGCRPGKPISGSGVLRSLPCDLLNARNCLRHFGAHHIGADVLGAGLAAAGPIEAGHRPYGACRQLRLT